MASKKALGRGLSALLPDAPTPPQTQQANIRFLPINQIAPNPFQPREKFKAETLAELKQSIAEKGLVQPVTVRRHDGGYQLIAGERRLRAVRDLGLAEIPAYILEVETDEEMIELAIIENIHREDLNAIDVAQGYRRLMEECHLTQEEVAVRVGKDRATVANFLRLLKLPRRIQESVQAEEISFGHARALLALDSAEEQVALWKRIVAGHLPVRRVEELVRPADRRRRSKSAAGSLPAHYVSDAENRLRLKLATKVEIRSGKKGGRIEIEYYGTDDLDRVVSMILGE